MGQDELEKSLPETETLTTDETKIIQMLSDLRRAEAPKDFDFHLNARIANGSPAVTRRPMLFPALKYALPLGLLLLVGGLIAFSGYFTQLDQLSPLAADTPRSKDTVIDTTVAKGTIRESDFAKTHVESVNPQPSKREETIQRMNADSVNVVSPAANKRNGDRSADFGQGGRIRTINPRGINPENVVRTPITNAAKAELSTGEVLTILGVEADFLENAWHVKAVNEGSHAANAGVQVGDVIQQINDRKVGKTIEFSGQFTGNSVTVLRGEKAVRLDLLQKQP